MTRLHLPLLCLAIAACDSGSGPASASPQRTETAIFAGGCFWCTEADFEKLPGVVGALSGYTGGRTANPTYERVSAGGTGHYEAVKVTYDPARVSYAQLARYYFRTVDPTDAGGQFCDRGESYRTAIFATPQQRRLAEAAKAEAGRSLKGRMVTPILLAARFYPAEDYHQDYYKKNPIRYRYYRFSCGREARLKEVWGR
ncbi:MAG TPA: peptide-methionine (S)-S-oxide reductase MsrA [Allosphingosinicella sp.]|uniref:peptide-methionine (S)-S-oxide reductase MsrA n=1 Tax=Allosphingosinicella sp. TaxID=2823234 RepID=UPI002EDB462E